MPSAGAESVGKFSEEQVDALIKKLARAIERVGQRKASVAAKSVHVDPLTGQKARRWSASLEASEVDLLNIAATARNLLEEVVRGDKSYLSEVFGGPNCERYWFLHQVISEGPAICELHAKDTRWQYLQQATRTIENVLKEQGTFKPFSPTLDDRLPLQNLADFRTGRVWKRDSKVESEGNAVAPSPAEVASPEVEVAGQPLVPLFAPRQDDPPVEDDGPLVTEDAKGADTADLDDPAALGQEDGSSDSDVGKDQDPDPTALWPDVGSVTTSSVDMARSDDDAKNRRGLVAIITDHRRIGGVTWYLLQVVDHGEHRFFLKRFSQFKALHDELRDHLDPAMQLRRSLQLPNFPKSGNFGIRQTLGIPADFSAQRKVDLQKYLQEIFDQMASLKDIAQMEQFCGEVDSASGRIRTEFTA